MNGSRQLDRYNWHGCAVVQFDLQKLGGRATVRDTRMDADGVLLNHESGLSVDEIVESFGVDREGVEEIPAFAARKPFLRGRSVRGR